MNETLLLAALLAGAPAPRAASFDCRKAATAIEKMICADPALAALDCQLAAAYRRALAISPRPDSIQSDQHSWLARERARCTDAACLKKAYGSRARRSSRRRRSPRPSTSRPS